MLGDLEDLRKQGSALIGCWEEEDSMTGVLNHGLKRNGQSYQSVPFSRKRAGVWSFLVMCVRDVPVLF